MAALAAGALTVLAFRPQGTPAPSIGDAEAGTAAGDVEATDSTVRADEPVVTPGPVAEPHPIPRWVWYLAYGITGAVAIGFEQVFFRLVDGIMRSNTYTFGHVLSLYLALLAVGAAVGSWVRPRVHDHQRAFLWIQFGVGASAGIAVLIFTEVLPSIGFGDQFTEWFSSGGFNEGFIGTRRLDELLFGLGIPLLIMGIPVLLMGSAFPFAQGLVTDDLETVGSRTGTLLVSNLAGNVAGALLTTFVLIEHVGTMGSYRGLLIPLAIAGVIAALLSPGRRARVAQAISVIVVMAAITFALPSNLELWAMLHATPQDRLALAESRSCTSALQLDGDQFMLTINGSGQNGYPFDDFHVLIGLLPVLAHPDPQAGAAIGLGAGSTSYAMLLDQRLDHLRSVELCSGHARLFQDHADRGVPEFVAADDR